MRRAAKPAMFRHSNMVSRKPTWPPFFKAGMSMRLVKDDDANSLAALAAASNAKAANVTEYAFEHDSSYQSLQFAFMNAIESMDHNNIMVSAHDAFWLFGKVCDVLAFTTTTSTCSTNTRTMWTR